MYKLHLILKYLLKRRIAWVSLFAVMLCTTMVLVVISVMGGWLRMFRASFHGLTGDVLVERSFTGFSHYQEMIIDIEKLPSVVAAVPTIETFGLLNIANLKPAGVQVMGIPIDRIGQVNSFPKSLYRGYNQRIDQANDKHNRLTPQQRQKLRAEAEELARHPSFNKPFPDKVYSERARNGENWPGMIAGIGVLDIRKNKEGTLEGRTPALYLLPVKLTVMGMGPEAVSLDFQSKSEKHYWIVDDSRTQVWQYDANSVYVPLDQLQKDLSMDATTALDEETGEKSEVPARVTTIHVRLKPGADLNAARDQVKEVVERVLARHRNNEIVASTSDPKVVTWEEDKATWIHAIENEKILMIFLFGIISVVAVFLIFCIFYMIVSEKTKDIGIIKSVGASSGGVAGIFLGYGAAIGIVGAGLGLLASYLLVHNINELHTWMGQRLGVQIWNPEVYLFDKIPNTMTLKDVLVIGVCAVLASTIGALLPAWRAARMNPVEALRWE